MSPRIMFGLHPRSTGTRCVLWCQARVLPGDAVIPPESEAPEVAVMVLAADDLVRIDSTVVADGEPVPADVDGVPVVAWQGKPITIDVEALGFEPWTFDVEEYPEAGRIEFRLEPVVLQGIVTTDKGRPLPGATVVLGDAQDTTDNEGRYALERAVPGTIEVDRPAWEPAEFPWDGSLDKVRHLDEANRRRRALRVAPEDLLEEDRWETILSLADISGDQRTGGRPEDRGRDRRVSDRGRGGKCDRCGVDLLRRTRGGCRGRRA